MYNRAIERGYNERFGNRKVGIMAREDNVAVFKDSMRICRDDPVFKSDTSSRYFLRKATATAWI